jgi:hypothetical protein
VTTIAGLTPAMCVVLHAVADKQVARDAFGPRRASHLYGQNVTATIKALHRRELITPGERVRRWERWQLTDAGRALLNRLDGAT